jgi:hypothetical protein
MWKWAKWVKKGKEDRPKVKAAEEKIHYWLCSHFVRKDVLRVRTVWKNYNASG